MSVCVFKDILLIQVHNYKPLEITATQEGRGDNQDIFEVLNLTVVFSTHFVHACMCTGYKKVCILYITA